MPWFERRGGENCWISITTGKNLFTVEVGKMYSDDVIYIVGRKTLLSTLATALIDAREESEYE